MLSLLRASEISFPGEKVMQEAKAFTREYLNQVLARHGDVTDVDQSLLREVNSKHIFHGLSENKKKSLKIFDLITVL